LRGVGVAGCAAGGGLAAPHWGLGGGWESAPPMDRAPARPIRATEENFIIFCVVAKQTFAEGSTNGRSKYAVAVV
jgi:hypothetical protein